MAALLAGLGAAMHAQTPVAVARQAIEARIARGGAEKVEVGVVWRPLDARPGEEILINPTLRFHAASTMKVPVLIELFTQAAAGRLRLDDQIPVTNQFISLADGSRYTLSASDDSDGDTYRAIGQTLSYRTLAETTITASGNLSNNILIERLGVANIKATLASLGASGMEVLRGVEDQKAFDLGMNNTTDAAALAVLFGRLGRGDVVNAAANAEMIAILKRQKHNTGIPAGVPAGTDIAHKTGSITRVHHDAGIVYAPRPYVLVVLTRGLLDQKDSSTLIADISRIVWPLGSQ